MIIYSPINWEVLSNTIEYYPRTVFIMTSLWKSSSYLKEIRENLLLELKKNDYLKKMLRILLHDEIF